MTPEQLEEGERLLAAATPGPWYVDGTCWFRTDALPPSKYGTPAAAGSAERGNGPVIVWAVNNAAALIRIAWCALSVRDVARKEIAELKAEVERLQAELDDPFLRAGLAP